MTRRRNAGFRARKLMYPRVLGPAAQAVPAHLTLSRKLLSFRQLVKMGWSFAMAAQDFAVSWSLTRRPLRIKDLIFAFS